MKTTEWFPPEIKPVHVGWYECQMCEPKDFHWFGADRCWHNSETNHNFLDPLFSWRGLAKEPR